MKPFALSIGGKRWRVQEGDPGKDCWGYCDHDARRIVLSRLSERGEVAAVLTHEVLHATQQSAGEQMLHGYSFGCLCQMAPLYMENNPTDWGHGYGLQEVSKGGTATTWPVAIEEGVSRLSSLVKRLGA